MSTDTGTDAPVGPITLTPANGGGPPTLTPPTGDDNADTDGGTFNIGIAPETLAAAAQLAEDSAGRRTTNNDNGSLPPIKVIPAVVTTTAATTSTAALVAGTALGPLGLAAVAAGTFAVDIIVIAATHKKGNARGAASKKGTQTTTTTRTTRSGGGRASAGGRTSRGGGGGSRSGLGSRGGSGSRSGNRPGAGGSGRGRGAGGGKGPGGAGGGGGKKNNPLKNAADKRRAAKSGLGPNGEGIGAKAKRGAALLANRKNNNGGGRGAGTGTGAGGGGRGAGTRAALRRAAVNAARGAGRNVARAARAVTPGRVRRGVAAAARGIGRGAVRAWNSRPARAARRATARVWNTRPVQTVRAAVRRAARATWRNVVRRPAAAVWRLIRRMWKRIRPGRGTYAHLLRTLGIGALAMLAGIASFFAIFGWVRHRKGPRMGLYIIRSIWGRLMARSRARRNSARRAETITGSVDDPGLSTDTASGTESTTDPDAMGTSEAEDIARRLVKQFVMLQPADLTMDRVGAEYKGLGPGIEACAVGVGVAAMTALKMFPDLPGPIMGRMKQLVGMLIGASSYATDMYMEFRRIHWDDIERYERPIKGQHAEARWNVVPVAQTDGIGIAHRPSVFGNECARIASHYAGFRPTMTGHVVMEFVGVGGTLLQIAAVVQRLTSASYAQPVDNVVRTMLGHLAQYLYACAAEAQMIGRLVHVWHNERIARMLAAAPAKS
jgi:hypothetical protein